eukprot:3237472-Prymnesium_polylepis.1
MSTRFHGRARRLAGVVADHRILRDGHFLPRPTRDHVVHRAYPVHLDHLAPRGGGVAAPRSSRPLAP